MYLINIYLYLLYFLIKGTQKRITQLQYYSYKLAIRPEFSVMHNAGKLFQQYCVDSYLKVESNNLKWYRMNQTSIRADSYKGLMDYVAAK